MAAPLITGKKPRRKGNKAKSTPYWVNTQAKELMPRELGQSTTHTSAIGQSVRKVDNELVAIGKPKNVKKTVTKQVIVGNKVTVQRVKYDPTTVNTKSIGKVCQHKDIIPAKWNYTKQDKVASMGLCGTNPFGK